MITSITKLKNAGIYKSFDSKTCGSFDRYNLIYGWNGSGKSTLSRVFKWIENRGVVEELPGLEVTFEADSYTYNSDNVQHFTDNIAIFNSDFVNDNIDWNGIINSILYIDEQNIEIVKEYQNLKAELYGLNNQCGEIEKLEQLKNEQQTKTRALDADLSNVAKTVKTAFQGIDMSGQRYLNYNRTKVKEVITLQPTSKRDLLSAEDLRSAVAAAKVSEKLEQIEFDIALKGESEYVELFQEVRRICSLSVTSQVIEALKKDVELSNWVETGIRLHKKNGMNTCAFCGNPLTNERISTLDSHYNKAFKQMAEIIDCKLKEIEETFYLSSSMLPDTMIFYEEYRERVNKKRAECEIYICKINEILKSVYSILARKKDNLFEIIQVPNQNVEFTDILVLLNRALDEVKTIVDANNKKSDEFEAAKQEAQIKVERHFVQQELVNISYSKKDADLNTIATDIKRRETLLEKKQRRYEELERKISSETLASAEFNNTLAVFLGHNEIKLVFDPIAKGYKVYRNNSVLAKNLSEGEKTAIAFTYFITKLKEKGKSIEDYILVIDDPISSFDSNKIFAAYAYLKAECESAKQLFILTHNYNFFSLILGWFNKKSRKDDGKKMPAFRLYRVENNFDEEGKRYATLRDGGESMKQATEYDYVFYNVLKLREKSLSKSELIYCGNICRKLLESFLSFKFPKQRADYRALLDKAFEGKADCIKEERIYKFTNIYSHDKKINALEELDDDILFANYESVIADVLDLIKELDSVHYEHMVEKVSKELF